MEKASLKAREIEALTFLFTADVPSEAAAGYRRRGWLRARPATVGLTAAVVVLAVLAWAVFFR